MKRLFVSILLITHLLSGLAFAMDVHPEAVMGHNAVDLEINGAHDHSNHEVDQADDHHDHHCCHGAAHVTGLINLFSSQVIAFSRDHDVSFTLVLSSLYITLLLRPPIV